MVYKMSESCETKWVYKMIELPEKILFMQELTPTK